MLLISSQKISTRLTFAAFVLGNFILRGGVSPEEVKKESIEENTLGKATLSDRSHALTSVGITALLFSIFTAIIVGVGTYLLFSAKSILVLCAFTLALSLLIVSAWYFIRSFFVDQKGKDTDEDDLADTVYFISDLENCLLFLFSIVTSATVTAFMLYT